MKMGKHDPRTEMELNMTSMIDVVFLLIIFFMIITDLTQQDLEDLVLPQARAAVEDKPDPQVGAALPDDPILIRADTNTEFEHIQRLMGICGMPGIRIWQIELAAAEKKERQEAAKAGK